MAANLKTTLTHKKQPTHQETAYKPVIFKQDWTNQASQAHCPHNFEKGVILAMWDKYPVFSFYK